MVKVSGPKYGLIRSFIAAYLKVGWNEHGMNLADNHFTNNFNLETAMYGCPNLKTY